MARHGYAADAPFIDTPRDARYHYAKRFGIEASYRLSEQSIATTSTQNPVVRLLYVVVSCCYRTSGGFYIGSTWRRPAVGGVASGNGRSRSSSTWSDGQRGRPSRRVGPSREPATGRPVYPVTFGRANLRYEWRRCRVGSRPPPTATARLRFVHASLVETVRAPFRHRTQASETVGRGCFVRRISLFNWKA